MTDWHEHFLVLASFLASAFAVLRLAVLQSKSVTDRFAGFLEAALRRQDQSLDQLRAAVDSLRCGVQENSLLMRQLTEWLQIGHPLGVSG